MLNYLSMAYLLSNISTEIYWNQTTIVEITVGGWVVSFFETQCICQHAPSGAIVVIFGVRGDTDTIRYDALYLRAPKS